MIDIKYKTIKKGFPKNIPEHSGVYLFRDNREKIIYVGKSINLRSRLRSYFSNKLIGKTQQMMTEATEVGYIKVNSELESLLLEARLVKKYMPHYNSALKDDKSPLYIAITNDALPRVVTLRKTQITTPSGRKSKYKKIYGPFLDGRSVKRTLKSIRKIIPYATNTSPWRERIEAQIGLTSPAPFEIEDETDPQKRKELKEMYLENIRKVQMILSGKLKSIQRQLEADMKKSAREERYEDAKYYKRQLIRLAYLTEKKPEVEPYLQDPNLLEDRRSEELYELQKILDPHFNFDKNISRVECYDIAHISGSHPTASMVTFIEGEADKTLYRHYKVSDKPTNNDTLSMKKVLERRKRRFGDWGKPDLIIVDGGKGQVSAAISVFEKTNIPVIGLAKRYETIIVKNKKSEFESIRLKDGPAKNLVQRLRNEAHRFARRYHHTLVKKALLQ